MKSVSQGYKGTKLQGKSVFFFVVSLLLCVGLFANVSAQSEPAFGDLFFSENAALLEDMGLPTPEPPVQLPVEAAQWPARGCEGREADEVNAANISPDGRYVVFFDCLNHDVGIYQVYGYDSQTSAIVTLGAINFYPEYWFVERWLDDSRFALQVSQDDAGTYGTRYLFIGDASEANSLQQIAYQYIIAPRFEDDPPRYIWVTITGDGSQYEVHMYDVGVDGSAIFFNRPCIPVEEFGCATLAAYPNDSFTSGDVSRMALLFSTPLSLEPKLLEIYEPFNYALIYSAELTDSGRVEWLDANRLLLLNVSFDLVSGTSSGRVVDTSAQPPIETDIERVYPFEALSPDREWLLVWAVGPDDGAVNVLNLETGVETPLLRSTEGIYTALLGWDKDEPHTVLARVDIRTGGNPAPVTVWRVGLNDE